MTLEEVTKQLFGQMAFQIAQLQTENSQLKDKLAEIEKCSDNSNSAKLPVSQ